MSERVNLPNSHSFFNISWSNWIGEIHNKLGELFHIDNVFRIIRIGVNNFSATGHLERLLVLEGLLISSQIPKSWRSKTSVTLFDTREFIYLLDGFLDVIIDLLDALVVLPLTVGLQ